MRVHNTLLTLVREERIERRRIEKMDLYVSIQPERTAEQIAARRELLASTGEVPPPLPPSTIIEVLVEVIHAGPAPVAPADVVKRLAARGVVVTAEEVEEFFPRYGLDPEKRAE